MKIFFTASIPSLKTHRPYYHAIVNNLKARGHTIFEEVLVKQPKNRMGFSRNQMQKWWTTFSNQLSDTDLVLAEASYPSNVQVGFLIGWLLAKGKPVILLYQEDKDPSFIDRHFDKRLVKSEYNLSNLDEVLDWVLEEVGHNIDRRFTFFISSDIDAYLDKVVASQGVSRAEFIRNLIENQMEDN